MNSEMLGLSYLQIALGKTDHMKKKFFLTS